MLCFLPFSSSSSFRQHANICKQNGTFKKISDKCNMQNKLGIKILAKNIRDKNANVCEINEVYDKDEQDGEKGRVWKMSPQNKHYGRG